MKLICIKEHEDFNLYQIYNGEPITFDERFKSTGISRIDKTSIKGGWDIYSNIECTINHYLGWYDEIYFTTLADWREEQINSILNG